MFGFLVMSAICIILVVSTNAVAQKSTILMGDKSIEDAGLSLELYSNQISDFKEEIVRLEGKKKEKIKELESNIEIMLKKNSGDKYVFRINEADHDIKVCKKQTDSLINIYRGWIALAEIKKMNFLDRSAGKDKQTTISLKGRNVGEVARAYRTIKSAEMMNSTNGIVSRNDTILVENNFYQSTFATVSCPETGFSKSFPMSPHTKVFLPIDGPGRYVVSFKTGNNLQCQDSEFDGVRQKGYDPVTKRSFALIAELPER